MKPQGSGFNKNEILKIWNRHLATNSGPNGMIGLNMCFHETKAAFLGSTLYGTAVFWPNKGVPYSTGCTHWASEAKGAPKLEVVTGNPKVS